MLLGAIADTDDCARGRETNPQGICSSGSMLVPEVGYFQPLPETDRNLYHNRFPHLDQMHSGGR